MTSAQIDAEHGSDIPDTPTGASAVGDPRWVRDTAAILVAAALLVTAILVPFYGSPELKLNIFVLAPPLFGNVDPHGNYSTAVAVAIGLLVIVVGPWAARTLRWAPLLGVTWLVTLAWTLSLALIDGWTRGVSVQLDRPDEYLPTARGVTGIGRMLSTFDSRILDFQPNSWPTHVSGHPAGALLSFVLLDRVGLGSGTRAGVFCIVVGTSAAVAILVAVRALGGESTARRIAPFAAVTPAAVWIGVSADGYFLGAVAWGIALLALSATTLSPRVRAITGIGAGALLAWGIFCNYGLTLMGVIALGALIVARRWRPLLWAIPAALVVVGGFALAGFWWLDGYHLVYERYYQGIASKRPYSYWVWANFAASMCAVGPAAVVGLGRALRVRPIRRREAVVVLGLAGLLAMVFADLSGLSKAETERIWLPFGAWIITTTALLPPRHQRFWLAAQVLTALLINSIVRTHW
ncbi:hypothetical protein [Williamsia deligens]|uniref:Integral membrane protein n=1 Tax=Williamsia deligens TaxID=321325 RepID=A0ABW3G4F6_9NOCA|nr:hypothetical protein [Williamsia deligens]